jgi:flavin reductase (DIM6/NTAB) family NADH-FMN oxidoreductase RutF
VTSFKNNGAPVGITVSSFTSVSLDPPLVLVCIHERSRVLDELLKTGRFGLNILAAHQEELSVRFAGPVPDKFEGLTWHRGSTGVPLLSGVLATLECSVERTVGCGDHQILIGNVLAVSKREGHPLIRYSSAYCSLATIQAEASLKVAAP